MGAEQRITAEAATLRDEVVQSFIEAAKTPVAVASPVLGDVMSTSAKILEVLSSYRLGATGRNGTHADEGSLKLLAIIYGHVKVNKPVPMCLPAFPFKSPNSKSKVLGNLPDKGEEMALAHLNGICLAVKDVYAPGAKLVIISDGLVYNDLLGVADKDVWAYGESLRAMCREKGFEHISFSRLNQLIHVDSDVKLSEITYVANATKFRSTLVNKYERDDYDASKEISQSEDTCLTYRGYIKFLQTDLQQVYPVGESRTKGSFKTGIEYIAKQMLKRGQAFAHAVRENFPDHVRLSIHQSTGKTKLSISPLPTVSPTFTTPWHCAVAFDLDGTLRSGHRAEFDADDNYDLVYENDRPSYYRHKSLSELVTWEKAPITATPIYPCGMMLTAKGQGSQKPYIDAIDAPKVRALAEHNSPVIVRGFKKTNDRAKYEAKAHEMGKPTPWLFGLVLEVKDGGNDTKGLNNVLSSEWMPFHFDGMFKTVPTGQPNADGSEGVKPNPPRFQMFTAVTPSPRDTGYTLFSASSRLLQYLPEGLTLDYLRTLTWSVTTSSFGAPKLQNLPLIIDHPSTGRPCLFYHEPWPQSKTQFQATLVNIQGEGVDDEKSASICEALDTLLHDRRVAYWHSWQKGDFLVSDNLAMLHTRSDFTSGCDRELWRIHFD